MTDLVSIDIHSDRALRVGIPTVVNGKIGLLSPRPRTGNTHPKDWSDYKEPIWDFIPVKTNPTKYDGWW